MGGRSWMIGVRQSSSAQPMGTLKLSACWLHKAHAAVGSGSSPGLCSHTVRLAYSYVMIAEAGSPQPGRRHRRKRSMAGRVTAGQP